MSDIYIDVKEYESDDIESQIKKIKFDDYSDSDESMDIIINDYESDDSDATFELDKSENSDELYNDFIKHINDEDAFTEEYYEYNSMYDMNYKPEKYIKIHIEKLDILLDNYSEYDCDKDLCECYTDSDYDTYINTEIKCYEVCAGCGENVTDDILDHDHIYECKYE